MDPTWRELSLIALPQCLVLATESEAAVPLTSNEYVPRTQKLLDQLLTSTKLSYQMMLYPLVYMLIWALPTSIRIYQAVSGKPAAFQVATADKACIVVQGLLDAIVYGKCSKKSF